MDYESLKVRPSSGTINLDAITAWLADKEYAFVDPIGGRTWYLSATRKEKEGNRQTYLANPMVPMPPAVQVHLLSHFIGMTPNGAPRAERKAIEFLRWLIGDGDWEVQLDQGAWQPIGDPSRLFPKAIEATDETDEVDHTIDDLTEGVRHTWQAAERWFIVHSSGQWRTELRDAMEKWRVLEAWRGVLSPSAMTEWNAAIAAAGELVMYVHADDATGSFELEDEEGIEKAWFDASEIPAPLMPLDSLVEQWVGELARRDSTSSSDDLKRVRRGY